MIVRSGITLLELLAVVVVIGILAVIAIPNLRRVVEQSYWREAQGLLQTIHDGEQQYFDKEDTYKYPLDNTSPMPDWRTIYMDDPHSTSVPVTFEVDSPSLDPTKFEARATYTPTGDQMTIDQNGILDTSGWPLP